MDEEHKKKVDNFWYYYKYHVLAGIFILFCAVVFIKDMMAKVDYDYNIAFVGDYAIDAEDSANLQKWFEENGEDLNGDGEIHVQLNDYFLSEDGDPQMFAASQTKFTVDVQEGTSMIFFFSQENYERFQEQGVFPEDSSELVDMKTCSGFEAAGAPASVQDMQGAMRLVPEESKIAKSEEKLNYYDACEKLFEKFIGE